jgi:hypothetical protein
MPKPDGRSLGFDGGGRKTFRLQVRKVAVRRSFSAWAKRDGYVLMDICLVSFEFEAQTLAVRRNSPTDTGGRFRRFSDVPPAKPLDSQAFRYANQQCLLEGTTKNIQFYPR